MGAHRRVREALAEHVRAQSAAVLTGDALMRLGPTPHAVHQTRRGVRGLRSVLRTLGPLLTIDAAESERIDRELRWLALLFSDVRDADVLARRLCERLDALPQDLLLGPVRQEVTETLGGIRFRAVAYATEQRAGDRYACLLDIVARWHEHPPVRRSAGPTGSRPSG